MIDNHNKNKNDTEDFYKYISPWKIEIFYEDLKNFYKKIEIILINEILYLSIEYEKMYI